MSSADTSAIQKRLSRIEGQVRGVSSMVGEGRYCIDIVTQIQAARAALDRVESMVLADHVETCVQTALASDDLEERRAKVDELIRILPRTKGAA